LQLKNKLQFKSRYTNYRKEINYSLGILQSPSGCRYFLVAFEYNTINFGVSYDYKHIKRWAKKRVLAVLLKSHLLFLTRSRKENAPATALRCPKFFLITNRHLSF